MDNRSMSNEGAQSEAARRMPSGRVVTKREAVAAARALVTANKIRGVTTDPKVKELAESSTD